MMFRNTSLAKATTETCYYPRQFVVKLQNIAYAAQKHKITRIFSRIIELIIRLIWCAHLPSGAKIHKSAHLGHSGLGVIINPECVIGENSFIGPHVVLGGKAPLSGAPILEKEVRVHSGAKLIGKITIGEGSVIGANSVVLTDIPRFSLVVGIPGKVIKTDINPSDYR